MKLNQDQIEIVAEELKNQNLIFEEFELEMLDHLCSSIENNYSDQDDFEIALHNEIYEFEGCFFEDNIWSNNFYCNGIQAVEMNHFKEIFKSVKKDFYSLLIRQFTTWKLVLWAILFFGIYQSEDFLRQSFIEPNSFLSGALAGFAIGFTFAAMSWFFGNSPIYVRETKSFLKYFPKIHALLNPKTAHVHSLRKLAILPFLLFSIAMNFDFWGLAFTKGLISFFIFLSIMTSVILLFQYVSIKDKKRTA